MKKKQTQHRKPAGSVIEELKDDIGLASAVKILHDSEGGQILIDALVADILGAVDALCAEFGTMSHIELVSLIAKMKERLDILKVMTGAQARQDVLEGLLKEELEKEDEAPPPDPHKPL